MANKKSDEVKAKSVKTKVTSKAKASKKEEKIVAPIDAVLEIKAKNEAKKAAKVKNNTAVEKNIVEAKTDNFLKTDEIVKTSCECKCPVCNCVKNSFKTGLFAAWARCYKNIFNYKGRTSRYEYWAFILVNILFFSVVEMLALTHSNAVISATIVLILGFISFLTTLSLIVRRLHDAGNSAWKGYFRPVIFSMLIIEINTFLEKYNLVDLKNSFYLELIVNILISVVGFIFIYYATKMTLVTSFGEEDNDNEYGNAQYNSKCYKAMYIRYATLIISMFFLIIVGFLSLLPAMH